MNYVLLSAGGKFGKDKKGGNGGSAACGRISISYQRNNLTRFVMHGKLTAIRADLAAEKAAKNRGEGEGGAAPAILPRRLGWPSQGFWGSFWGEKRPTRMTKSWGI